ncbi:MAG: helix-turn-helix transcriptional regulator [Lachnospiraceae bacterium]|nr:helix-turn-helix transcriptional regulator [Lachnospiraceae bacterium]MBR5766564.1 helix-turn-helix transcriptional regulator [Lachnospiraceae bacterium]MBR6468907.1 helix-turn-helix transcriptional regulator [Lachnospiraceae bacterium]MBR6485098.1 helix-turn-helix transcriptional regulator [Lachnospiraceae bacterium]
MSDTEKGFYSDEVIRELIAYRKKHKLTQQDISERSGIMRPNIARLESMRAEPSMDVLSRYAASMGMDIKISLVKKKQ